jgi:hypothetical protein
VLGITHGPTLYLRRAVRAYDFFAGKRGGRAASGSRIGKPGPYAEKTPPFENERRSVRKALRRLASSYLLIIFRLAAAIVLTPPFSVTSPVSSTLWLMCGTSLALLFAARSPVTT